MKFVLVVSLLLCVAASVPVEEAVKEAPPAPAVPVEGALAAPDVAAVKVVEEPVDDLKLEMEETKEEEFVQEGDMVVEETFEDEGMKMEEEEEVLGYEVEPDLRHELVFEDPEEMADNMVNETPQTRLRYCPDGWFKHESRCFLFVSSPMSWFNAEEHCNSLGASLASAQNPREYRFLQQLTQTASQTVAWIGGFYLQGRWMWIDRQGFYYTNWYSQSSVTSYPCVYLRSNNGWGNTNCGTSLRFICSSTPSYC